MKTIQYHVFYLASSLFVDEASDAYAFPAVESSVKRALNAVSVYCTIVHNLAGKAWSAKVGTKLSILSVGLVHQLVQVKAMLPRLNQSYGSLLPLLHPFAIIDHTSRDGSMIQPCTKSQSPKSLIRSQNLNTEQPKVLFEHQSRSGCFYKHCVAKSTRSERRS